MAFVVDKESFVNVMCSLNYPLLAMQESWEADEAELKDGVRKKYNYLWEEFSPSRSESNGLNRYVIKLIVDMFSEMEDALKYGFPIDHKDKKYLRRLVFHARTEVDFILRTIKRCNPDIDFGY